MPASKIENILAHVLMPRVINLEKMDLIPSQVATNMGILYASPCHQTRGRLMVTNWLSIVEGSMASDESPPACYLLVREWTQWRMQAKIKGWSHVRQDICCFLLEKSRGDKSASDERFCNRHICGPVKENYAKSPSPSRTF